MAEAVRAGARDPAFILKSIFGHDQFRPLQEDLIRHVIAGGDALALMPTGAGKSLCYQIPALCRAGTALIISPLVALMRAQVNELQARGLQAATLHSDLGADETAIILDKLACGALDFLYIAPERAATPRFLKAIETASLSLMAVDEAHCISQWGHDFRPAYQELHGLIARQPDCPRLALTGTADHRTLEDIKRSLWLGHARLFRSGFARSNIALHVTNHANASTQGTAPETTIIYCRSRARTERVAKRLNAMGRPALAYHAGLPAGQRSAVEQRFLDQAPVTIVATVAFGMGLSRSDVRSVIHLDPPPSLEAYWQEVGRAGRDGADAKAQLTYGVSEALALRRLAERAGHAGEQAVRERINAMIAYAETDRCRHQTVLDYFGENNAAPCGQCDRCIAPVRLQDGTEQMLRLLSTLRSSGPGMGPKRLSTDLENQDDTVSWTSLVRQAISCSLIIPVDEVTSRLMVSEHGHAFLTKPKAMACLVDWRSAEREIPVSNPTSTDTSLRRLHEVRQELAATAGLPPALILHDQALKAIADAAPDDLDALQSVAGIGTQKAARFGAALLRALRS